MIYSVTIKLHGIGFDVLFINGLNITYRIVVILNGSFSTLNQVVSCNVLQGSLLGPLLLAMSANYFYMQMTQLFWFPARMFKKLKRACMWSWRGKKSVAL